MGLKKMLVVSLGVAVVFALSSIVVAQEEDTGLKGKCGIGFNLGWNQPTTANQISCDYDDFERTSGPLTLTLFGDSLESRVQTHAQQTYDDNIEGGIIYDGEIIYGISKRVMLALTLGHFEGEGTTCGSNFGWLRMDASPFSAEGRVSGWKNFDLEIEGNYVSLTPILYYPGKPEGLNWFIGAGLTYFEAKNTYIGSSYYRLSGDIDIDGFGIAADGIFPGESRKTMDVSGFGYRLVGGAAYFFSPTLSLDLRIDYRKTTDERHSENLAQQLFRNDASEVVYGDYSGVSAMLGLRYYFL